MRSPVKSIHVKIPGLDSQVAICTKGQWDELLIALKIKDTATLKSVALRLCDKLSAYAPDSIYLLFCDQYKKAIDEVKEKFADYYSAPYTPYDPEVIESGKTKENMELPIMTFAENLVYIHTGLDFIQIDGLDYLEYCMYLSDAMKLRILNNRGYEKGTAYLNECYRFSHKINSGF